MRKDTLYVSDLDGTLLGTDSRISARSAEMISEMTRQGAHITVATARTPATVVPLLAATDTRVPAVVMTGCAYWLRDSGRFDRPKFIPQADVEATLDICRSAGAEPFVYLMAADGRTLDVYHGERGLNKAEESFYLERCHLALKRFHLGTPVPAAAGERTMLFYAMGTEAAVVKAYEQLRSISECSMCCYPDIFNPRVMNLEVFPPKVDKAAAVMRLKEELGAERLVVFGDSLNDLPMLAAADVAVAVGNALESVKAAADIVVEPNYTDSVARFIEAD